MSLGVTGLQISSGSQGGGGSYENFELYFRGWNIDFKVCAGAAKLRFAPSRINALELDAVYTHIVML